MEFTALLAEWMDLRDRIKSWREPRWESAFYNNIVAQHNRESERFLELEYQINRIARGEP